MLTDCARCQDKGEVKIITLWWLKEGRRMQDDRLSRNLTLKKEADRRGISIIELSDMERGFIEPKRAEGETK